MPEAPSSAAATRRSTTRSSAAQFNGPLVHEVVRAELNALRQGTAATKTRGNVRGGGAKPWRQKGTGRARAGSSRSPLWKGGGTVFGPSPRHYTFKVNRKARRAALRSALSVHADRGSIAVFDATSFGDALHQAGRKLLKDWGQPLRDARAARRARRPTPACRSATWARARDAGGGCRRRRHHRRGVAADLARPRSTQITARANGEAPAAEEVLRSHGREPGHHPSRRLGEDLRAGGDRQVHVPRPRGRAQDADPAGDRAAVRREGARRAHRVGQEQAEAPRHLRRSHAHVEEGDRPAPAGRHDPDLPGPGGHE